MIAFKKVFMKFNFKSPLNFIMVPHDFEHLYTAIYHAQQLAYYLTNFIADSVFTFDSDKHDKTHKISELELILRQKARPEGKEVGDLDE
jgi:hypothetical protein